MKSVYQPESQLIFITKIWQWVNWNFYIGLQLVYFLFTSNKLFMQKVELRQVLKWTNVYGYYLPEDKHANRQFFEYLKDLSFPTAWRKQCVLSCICSAGLSQVWVQVTSSMCRGASSLPQCTGLIKGFFLKVPHKIC